MLRFCSFTPTASAAVFTSFSSCALPGKAVVPKTAMRESFGMISLRRSRRLPLSSRLRFDNPVMLPPGRARLVTNPLPTGSGSWVMTMGIVMVASLAARVAVEPLVTIRPGLSRTSSAANWGRRPASPLAQRLSMTIFCPST